MIFGNSGISKKAPRTTGNCYTEQQLAGKVLMSKALSVKVPKEQSKYTKKTMSY